MNKNNKTEIVFILDRSGSMAGLEKDTTGGFNSMLEKQKKLDGTCYVSTILFDHETVVLHDRLPLEKVQPITEREYAVRGSTALLDAIGGAISHIGNIHKYARPEDVPEKTLFVITTDGMENASHIYDKETVMKQINRQKEKYGWEFIFMAANIDAVETAREIGIGADRAMNFYASPSGVGDMFQSAEKVMCCMRKEGRIVEGWKEIVKLPSFMCKKNNEYQR